MLYIIFSLKKYHSINSYTPNDCPELISANIRFSIIRQIAFINKSLLKSSMDQKIQPTEKELHSRIKNNEGKIIKLNQTLLNLKKK